MAPPRVLLIGGLDPTGGAGLAADVRMASALGVHPATVATCLTVQNRYGFRSMEPVDAALVRASLDAVFEDGPIHAVKVGLVGSAAMLELVLGTCNAAVATAPVVVDPVLSATAGGMEAAHSVSVGGLEELVEAYLANLPRITVLTPNLPEMDRLAPSGSTALLEGGCRYVLVKGGHAKPEADGMIEDRLVYAGGVVTMRHPRIERGPVHGTGCALATAVASRLAQGAGVETASRGAVADLEASMERTPHAADGLSVPLAISASRNWA